MAMAIEIIHLGQPGQNAGQRSTNIDGNTSPRPSRLDARLTAAPGPRPTEPATEAAATRKAIDASTTPARIAQDSSTPPRNIISATIGSVAARAFAYRSIAAAIVPSTISTLPSRVARSASSDFRSRSRVIAAPTSGTSNIAVRHAWPATISPNVARANR